MGQHTRAERFMANDRPWYLRHVRAIATTSLLAFALSLPWASGARAQVAEAPPTEASPPAGADETVGDQGVESARRAREEFRAGIEHYQASRYVEAIHSFQVAASLIPSADLWFNIASAYEQLARTRGELTDFEQAISHYRRYLTEQVDPPDRAAVEANIVVLAERLEAAREAQTVDATTGTLRVRSEFEGATVRVDADVIGQTPIDEDLSLAPGRHRVEATREGYIPFLAEISLDVGVPVTTRIDLMPSRTHRPIVQDPIFAWVAWGLAGASLIGSVIMGVIAQGLQPSQAALDAEYARARADMDNPMDLYAPVRDMGAGSDALLAATAGLASVGIALFFIESRAIGTVTERDGIVEE